MLLIQEPHFKNGCWQNFHLPVCDKFGHLKWSFLTPNYIEYLHIEAKLLQNEFRLSLKFLYLCALILVFSS